MICAMRWCGAGFLLSMASGACYHGGEVCSNGQSMACEGDDGCAGQQVCQDDGSFGACLCKAAPDDEESGSSGDEPGSTGSGTAESAGSSDGSGTTESAGSSDGSTTTGAPPDETGSGEPPCEPSTCDEMEGACGIVDDGCGHTLECLCPGDVACLEGVCQTSCESTSFSIHNNQKNEEHQCGWLGSAQRTSVMVVVTKEGEVASAGEGQSVVIDVPIETTEKVTVICCLTSDEACADLPQCNVAGMKEYCECTDKYPSLTADSCDTQNIQGCS